MKKIALFGFLIVLLMGLACEEGQYDIDDLEEDDNDNDIDDLEEDITELPTAEEEEPGEVDESDVGNDKQIYHLKFTTRTATSRYSATDSRIFIKFRMVALWGTNHYWTDEQELNHAGDDRELGAKYSYTITIEDMLEWYVAAIHGNNTHAPLRVAFRIQGTDGWRCSWAKLHADGSSVWAGLHWFYDNNEVGNPSQMWIDDNQEKEYFHDECTSTKCLY
ncbi:MAG: hypothetical protein QNJ97_11055 [Myxococcota bacterium]|nr:hypothetical protein [Myxococcota bacterium]